MKNHMLAALCAIILPLTPNAVSAQENYIGQIMMMGGNYCPSGWAPLDGRKMSVGGYPALFSYIGTNFGGDGRSSFLLPNMQARSPVHRGKASDGGTIAIGHAAGDERVTMSVDQIPTHSHDVRVTPQTTTNLGGRQQSPGDMVWAISPGAAVYGPYPEDGDQRATMNNNAMIVFQNDVGKTKSIYNRDPYLGILFCIATQGLYPPKH